MRCSYERQSHGKTILKQKVYMLKVSIFGLYNPNMEHISRWEKRPSHIRICEESLRMREDYFIIAAQIEVVSPGAYTWHIEIILSLIDWANTVNQKYIPKFSKLSSR